MKLCQWLHQLFARGKKKEIDQLRQTVLREQKETTKAVQELNKKLDLYIKEGRVEIIIKGIAEIFDDK